MGFTMARSNEAKRRDNLCFGGTFASFSRSAASAAKRARNELRPLQCGAGQRGAAQIVFVECRGIPSTVNLFDDSLLTSLYQYLWTHSCVSVSKKYRETFIG